MTACWAQPNDVNWRCIDLHPDFPHTWCDEHAAEVRATASPEDGPYRSELKAWARAVGRNPEDVG